MAHGTQPADPEGGGGAAVICDCPVNVAGVASKAEFADVAAVSGVAAAAGAAAVVSLDITEVLFTSGGEAAPRRTAPGLSSMSYGLFSRLAPLIGGHIKAKMVASNRRKNFRQHMAESGRAGWK